jgi:hypothetical protein
VTNPKRCLSHSQLLEQFDGSIRKSGPRVAAFQIRGVAGLPVTRQIEGDEATILRNVCLHLIEENATAERIAMDQQDWYAVMATLLDCDEAMGCGHQPMLHGYAHVIVLV